MCLQQNVSGGWHWLVGRLLLGLALLTSAGGHCACAADAPPVLKGIQIDAAQRTLQFTAAVNQREGAVEYVLVHGSGKVHESLLRTEIEPQDLHTAMLLVAGKIPTNGLTVEITTRWTNETGIVTQALAQLVRYTDTHASLEGGPWRYSGSEFFDGKFLAQTEGSMIALMHDPVALVNNPRRGRERDDLWEPNTGALPAIGTPVEVVLRFITSNASPK